MVSDDSIRSRYELVRNDSSKPCASPPAGFSWCRCRPFRPCGKLWKDVRAAVRREGRAKGAGMSMIIGRDQRRWGRGLVLGRSLDRRPQPVSEEVLRDPLRVGDLARTPLSPPSWREKAMRFAQASGLYTIPRLTRLRWAARDHIIHLQTALGAGREGAGGPGRRQSVTHPQQVLDAIEFLMGLPPDLAAERRVLRVLLARALIGYRKAISAQRGKGVYYHHEARKYFARANHDQKLLSQVTGKSERFSIVQNIINNYYYFRLNYICAILVREPVTEEDRLFSKFLRMVFFMARVEDDGTVLDRPARRALPLRDHVVFLVRRDAALQARLRREPTLQEEVRAVLRYFRA